MASPLFPTDPPLARRQPKTDRLIIARLLRTAADDMRLDEARLREAHAGLVDFSKSLRVELLRFLGWLGVRRRRLGGAR